MFTKKGNGFPLVFGNFIDESELTKINGPKGSNVKDVFGNINLEKVSDKSFFRAQPLITDNDGNMILFYKSDLSEKAQIILESISIEGKTNWTVKDSSFIHIGKSFSSEDIECIYTSSVNLIILSIFTDQQLYIGIDVKTGKILWNFYPEKYANENSSCDH